MRLFNVWAQDVIILRTGNEIKAIVQEVGKDDVKYKKWDNQTGPTYTLNQSEILIIEYENGSSDKFNTNTSTKTDNTTNATIPNNSTQSNAQNKAELLEISKTNANRIINSSGVRLSKDQVRSIMAIEPKALALYNKGVSNNNASLAWGLTAAGFSVMGLVFYPVDTEAIDGEIVCLGLVSGALVCLIPCLVLSINGTNKIETAVDIYNGAVIKQRQKSMSLNFGVTPTGSVGLVLNF